MKLVCLLPVRNGAEDLPGYLASVRGYCDAVVALDDGSTDASRELLEADPLVKVLLTNPRRESYRGWDDAANRNRLLAASAELEPEWIISLDADERIDGDDAAALHALLARDALPGFAYGFKVHRMVDDLSRYDRDGLWIYRLFAHEPGQTFPKERLHFVPVPTSIPRLRWLRTTLRIQHLASLTPQHREARFHKYRQADPHSVFQRDYTRLLDSPRAVSPWRSRSAGLPLLVGVGARSREWAAPDDQGDALAPALSAITVSYNDEATIEEVVRSVVEQHCPEPFEVIVVTSGTDGTARRVRERFPTVRVVELGERALPGEARNAGLAVARGEYVTFPGSHVRLPPGSLAARVAAHDLGYAMVTPTTLNGTPTSAGWAAYFLDHSTSLPGRPSEVLKGPPVHCSYRRDVLLEIGGFPPGVRAGEDTAVNRELLQRGFAAYRAREVRIVHVNRCTTLPQLVSRHFVRGRAMGRLVLGDCGLRGLLGRDARRQLSVPRRLSATTRNVERWGGDLRVEYRRVFPLVELGATAAWVGACYEIARSSLVRRRPRDVAQRDHHQQVP